MAELCGADYLPLWSLGMTTAGILIGLAGGHPELDKTMGFALLTLASCGWIVSWLFLRRRRERRADA